VGFRLHRAHSLLTLQQPNQTAQLLGAGLGAYGAFGRRKEGGQIKQYQEGGQIQRYSSQGQVSPTAMSTMAVQELPKQLKRLSDSQLAAYARTVKDAITLSAVQSEMMRRSKVRAPMGEMPQETVAAEVVKRAGEASIGRPAVGMYGGGIVALQAGGQPEDEYDLNSINPPPPVAYNPLANRFTGPMSAANNGFMGRTKGAPRALNYATENTPAVTLPTEPIVPTLPEVQADPPITDMEGGVADGVGITALSKQTPPAPAAAPTATQGATPSFANMSFDQWRQMGSQVAQDPADLEVLADMKARVDSRMARAESQENTAKFDAILMAGLAMMGGTSLADGIARAAQTGGATFLAGKKDAAKAVDAAEDAELAFNKYKLALRKGDEDSARKDFAGFMSYAAKMADIDVTREVGLARASAVNRSSATTGLDAQARLLQTSIYDLPKRLLNNPKYSRLVSLNAQRDELGGTLDATQEQERRALELDYQSDLRDAEKPLRNQLDRISSQLSGSSTSDGIKVLGIE
jgi:hypothetical protein